MIKVGDVCIWQNVEGAYAFLNGTETTVTGPLTLREVCDCEHPQRQYLTYLTDTHVVPNQHPLAAAVWRPPQEVP